MAEKITTVMRKFAEEASNPDLAQALQTRSWEAAVELLSNLNYLAQHAENVADVPRYLNSSEQFLGQLVDILREN